MSQAKADLVREVLGELFTLATGQTVNTDDSTWVEQRIETTLAGLAKLDVIYIADSEDIPDEVFNPLVAYLAEICGPKFGKPRNPAAKQAAEDELRTLQRIGSGKGGPLKIDAGLLTHRRRSYFRISG